MADVEVNKETGKIAVKHLYGALDAGLTVNPGLVENQMVGLLMQGTSRTERRPGPRLPSVPGRRSLVSDQPG